MNLDKASAKKPRILVGVTEVAGYFVNLFLGFKKLGYDVGYLNTTGVKFGYTGYQEHNYYLLNLLITVSRKVYTGTTLKDKVVAKIAYYPLKMLVFVWMCFKFDVFIYAAGSSLLNYIDYRILHLLGKKIVYVSLGSDSRPQYINGNFKDDAIDGKISPEKIIERNRQIIAVMRKAEKYATILINYPQHAHFHSRSFISGMFIGFPTRFGEERIQPSLSTSNKVRILHAPTRPKAKGSIEFRKIITELQSEGYQIEFIEITNKTNSEVLAEIQKSDIVLDELYSDISLGGLGVEAALYGKPVVVGGYYAEIMQKNIPASYMPPSHYCHPDKIKETLKNLLSSAAYRLEQGILLQNFVFEQWKMEVVAEKYIQIMTNEYPKEWMYAIEDIDYLMGWGMSLEEVKAIIQKIISEHGMVSLALEHNRVLEKKYQDLVKG